MAVPLLVRFPKLRARAVSWPVIPAHRRGAYPELAADFAVIDREVAPAFAEYDEAALRHQNRYRRQQVRIVLGSALVTGLGGLQAIFPDQRWPGLLLPLLGIALAASTRFAKERASLDDYLSERVKAERLRAMHFQYLSATGRYAGADREIALRRAVLAIRAGKELE
ncbi:MAG TPA: DUF4231 domain-containing protein [Planosporangium sp.]|jgi:hypothetical protein|nr:DUF4231 domain-containing protein [Planosporangium sp.]